MKLKPSINKQQAVSLFLEGIKQFFSARPVARHYIFLDHWLEALIGSTQHKKWTNAPDLFFFYNHFVNLFEAAYTLAQHTDAVLDQLALATSIELEFIATEQQSLSFYPNHLKEKELQYPLKTIQSLFKLHDFTYYQYTLKEWFAEALHTGFKTGNDSYIFPTYGNAKKLIAACWLIHERVISKNSFNRPLYQNALQCFALTAPDTFKHTEAIAPYQVIKSFFAFASLNTYRAELNHWFLMATHQTECHTHPKRLLLIHHQLIQLLQAGYLIVSNNLPYKSKPNNYNSHAFGSGPLNDQHEQIAKGEVGNTAEAPQLLSSTHMENPLAYCKTVLTLTRIGNLRYGLMEWLHAALHNQSSISKLDAQYLFPQYLCLQQLIEAFYLIAKGNDLPSNLSTQY